MDLEIYYLHNKPLIEEKNFKASDFKYAILSSGSPDNRIFNYIPKEFDFKINEENSGIHIYPDKQNEVNITEWNIDKNKITIGNIPFTLKLKGDYDDFFLYEKI